MVMRAMRRTARQLMAGVEKLEARSKPVKIIQSHVGDDFNDLMRGIKSKSWMNWDWMGLMAQHWPSSWW